MNYSGASASYPKSALINFCDVLRCFFYVMLLVFSPSAKASTLPENLQTRLTSFTQTQIMRFVSCTSGSIKLIPLSNSFEQFLITGNKLDLDCLSKLNEELSEPLKFKSSEPFASGIKFISGTAGNGLSNYEYATFASPLSLSIGESDRYTPEDIIRTYEQYFYLVSTSDAGTDAEMPDSGRILFKVNMATHVRNILFNIEHEVLIELPDGELEFSGNEILVFGQKSFLSEQGAFWFDSSLNQYGERISLIDVVGGECIPKNKFSEDFVALLTRDGKETLCVTR